MSPDDAHVLARQLGREPRGTWRVSARCPHGAPTVISVAPLLEDGTPFPTTFWLTCPAAVGALHRRESAGEHVAWAERAASEPALADSMAIADREYRAARAQAGGGVDPTPRAGVAGERDALRVKCLHARVAAFVAGVPDPVGEQYAATDYEAAVATCDGTPCAATDSTPMR